MTKESECVTTQAKEYSTPRLTVYGDVARLTQGHGDPGCGPSAKDCGAGDGNSRLVHPLMS